MEKSRDSIREGDAFSLFHDHFLMLTQNFFFFKKKNAQKKQ